jgi:uncharacterized delta-60 repeat protein
LLILQGKTISQPTLEWEARFNGLANNADFSNAMCIDLFSNVYVTGRTADPNNFNDILTVKYNQFGDTLWTRIYNGPGNLSDEALAVVTDSSGNVYVCGKSFSVNGLDDFVTIKYSSTGTEQWIRRYGGNLNDIAYALTVDNSGNVYVTGGISESNGFDFATIKYNSAGDSLWVKKYNGLPGNSSDIATSISIDNTGNVLVTGTSWGGISNYDCLTIKYDPNGAQQWLARYNGAINGTDRASMMVLDQTGNIYVTGSTTTSNGFDYVTLKYSTLGETIWIRSYNGTGNGDDKSNSICIDSAENVYVTGESRGAASFADYVTIKYNQLGDSMWVTRYNGSGNNNDIATSIAFDILNNVYITGESSGAGSSIDFVTIKYNAAGVEQWNERYNGSGNAQDIPRKLVINNNGNIYVSGGSIGNGSSYDCITLKYSQTIGIQPVNHQIPTKANLFQNYPNPFNSNTIIKFDIFSQSFVKLILYDMIGREIKKIIYEDLNPGVYSIDFSAINLSSAVYIYTLSTTNFVESKKLILIK